ncbi:MAG: PQQ-dependent sugar dehydrogenase, partial [Planctomycetota bacterium]|nr:PQQ-dependent sugar dehydrogenase [Planctomycetota bacterium]
MHRLRLPVLLSLATSLTATASADITYTDFSTSAGLNLVDAARVSGGRLLLDGPSSGTRGAAWATTPQTLVDPWTSTFKAVLNPGGAGMAFIVQASSPTAIGNGGCAMGLDLIPWSISIELDTQVDFFCGSGLAADTVAPHVAVNQGTIAASLGVSSWVAPFDDGLEHMVRITYAPGSLQVYVDDLASPALTVALDLAAALPAGVTQGWVGFTAARDGAAGTHEVLEWTFDEQAQSPSGNTPPATTVISEPGTNGQQVNPFDVHMETLPFSDTDAGDALSCSDYEIWQVSPPVRVWRAACKPLPTALHMHLGDGVFEGPLTGRGELDENTTYTLRARHRDSSGDPASEWGGWGERMFATGDWSQRFPLEVEDVLDNAPVDWLVDSTGQPASFPSFATGRRILLESPHPDLMLELAAGAGGAPSITNGPLLSHHEPVRVTIEAGSSPLSLPPTNLIFYDQECERAEVLLPGLSLASGATRVLWVASDGTTWNATSGPTQPSFNTLARGFDIPWLPMQEGYRVEVVAEGFTMPVNVAFVPNPGTAPDDILFYVTELYGAIRTVSNDGTVGTYASGLLNYTPSGAFPGDGEQGLTGIDVDPNSGDVYASMLYNVGGTRFPKVVRFTSVDGGRTAATQDTILDLAGEPQGQSHQISNLHFMPDGSLLVHNGDGFNASTGQNLNSARGKVLRILKNGSAYPLNPFFDPSDGLTDKDLVWSYGLRNPFGGDYRVSDGSQYCVENGPSVDRIIRIDGGVNYGWNGTNSSMSINALHTWAPAVGPVNIAFTQSAVFNGSGFPFGKMDHAFITESGPTYASGTQANGKRITEWVIDSNGDLAAGPLPFLEYTGTGRSTTVGLCAGPDGLYFTELYADGGNNPTQMGARVLRVYYEGFTDCNGNGLSDVCDIATGASSDSNGDGIPDECSCSPTTVCNGSLNSTGLGAAMTSTGGCTVASNDVAFEVTSLPTNQFGYLVCSQTTASVAVGQGILCLGAPIGRFNTSVQNSGAN